MNLDNNSVLIFCKHSNLTYTKYVLSWDIYHLVNGIPCILYLNLGDTRLLNTYHVDASINNSFPVTTAFHDTLGQTACIRLLV